jgi:two-component system NtrC family sensor kinase
MAHIPERRKNVRRRDEESLRKSEEKYRNILESIEEGYYEVDLAGNLTSFNDSICQAIGYPRVELMGINYRQYTNQENAKKLFQAFNEVYRTGKTSKGCEYEIIKKDGTKSYVVASISLRKDSSGKKIGFRGIIRDITERKISEETLRQSEEKYHTLLDNASDAILLANEEGNLLEVNRKAGELLGYTRKELLGVNISRIHPKEELEKIINGFKEINKKGLGTVNNTAVLKKDGTTFFVDISGSVIEYSGKKVLQAIFRDITERKKMEEMLRKSEQRYRNILESIREGYFELDLDGNYTFANEANCRYLGYTEKELIGMNYRRHTSEENARKLYKPYLELYRTGKPIETLEVESIRKDGTKVIYETSVSLIRDDEGKPIGFRGLSRDITERKKMEDALYQSEEKYRTILKNMQEGYFEVDLAGNLTFVNDAMCENLRFAREELIGMNFRQYTDETNARKLYQVYNKIYRTGEPVKTADFEFIRKDGTKVIYETSVSLIRDDEGKPIGFRGLSRDITERKRMEEYLRQSEEKYRTILESIDDGYYEIDLEGNYTFANDAEGRNLGYTKEELLGMNNRQYQDEESAKKTYQAFLKIYRTGQPIKALEMEVIRKNGTKKFNEISASLIRDTEGKPVGFRGITHDITERRHAEEALRKSEEKYRTVLEEMEEGYFEIDLSGNFTFVNNAECRNMGYSREELIGMNNRQYQDEATIRRMYQVFNNMYKTGEPIKILDLEIIRKDGTKKFNGISLSLIRDSKGKPTGFRGVSRDITERKRTEESLKSNQEELIKKNKEIEESRRNVQLTLERLGAAYEELKTTQSKIIQQERMASIGQLAAGVAHEINNPMAFIASNLGTLDKYIRRLKDFIQAQAEAIKSLKAADASEKLEKKRKQLKLDYTIDDIDLLVKESLEGSERVQKIVQGLNRFSRVDDAEYKDTNINECIESSINIVWNELKHKATLHKDYGELPSTKCYPQQLNQVFVNILLNAVQSIKKQGEIAINTWSKDGSIWITVSDTGCGISKENQSKIFEPFFTTKEVGKGTGLGLSISYEIIQRHKGEISLRSEKGKGTTFTIRIPVV